ncbi:enoyl-CoA hydratase/isomerase family protein [Thalassospiraceae bacterium LMO-JJ14]|nr:enoyl-CoA hydratase/isomerase family protein [Thalassospiraceae bacterium LMO-JJ14]
MAKNTTAPLITEISGRGVATITLRRPDIHNAFDDELIERLRRELQGLNNDPVVRVVVLAAEGKSFSAGADLNWMKRMAEYERAENLEDAKNLGKLMATLYRMRQPTVAVVQGAAYGGGVGLVAACNIAIASDAAHFCLSEVRLGLIPAVIGPYVIEAMGERQAMRYMLTAEKFSAKDAMRLGLVHDVVPADVLQDRRNEIVEDLLKGGPKALTEIKNLVSYITNSATQDEKVVRDTAGHIARVRATEEGQEGVAAFLEKRKAKWVKD